MSEPEDKVEEMEWSSKGNDKILTPSIPSGSLRHKQHSKETKPLDYTEQKEDIQEKR